MITYNDLYEAARKERYSDQLQNLPKNFIEEISIYLKEKKQLSLKDDDIFSDMITKTKKQLENAITLFRELIIRRRKKILNLVLIAAETGISKQDFDNMLSFEKTLFEELMKNVEISDKKLNEILTGKKIKESKNEMVIFKKEVGEFVDLEGEKIGPFEKGQIVNIPRDVAKILIEDGKAEILDK
ncbi:hypothetical protein K0A97_03010 [Patescibacteria group bacterium]|nr:hypothetical protein [Patescibacteria group bacterium]